MTLEEYKNNLNKQLDPQESVITRRVGQYRDVVNEIQLKARNDKDISVKEFIDLIYHCEQEYSKGLWYEWENENKAHTFDYYKKKLVLLKKAFDESFIERDDYDKFFYFYIDQARENSNISLVELLDLIKVEDRVGEYNL